MVVNDTPFIIDWGPAVVFRVAAANRRGGIGIEAGHLRRLFPTHHNPDHTAR